jgi:hypothetical protein
MNMKSVLVQTVTGLLTNQMRQEEGEEIKNFPVLILASTTIRFKNKLRCVEVQSIQLDI